MGPFDTMSILPWAVKAMEKTIDKNRETWGCDWWTYIHTWQNKLFITLFQKEPSLQKQLTCVYSDLAPPTVRAELLVSAFQNPHEPVMVTEIIH